MLQKILLTIFILILAATGSKAQDTIQQGYCYHYVPSGEIINQVDTIYTFHCKIYIADTITAQQVIMKIGSSFANLGDILDNEFLLNSSNYLPEGFTFQRVGNLAIITVDNFLPDLYFFDIRLMDGQGILSEKLLLNWEICDIEISNN